MDFCELAKTVVAFRTLNPDLPTIEECLKTIELSNLPNRRFRALSFNDHPSISTVILLSNILLTDDFGNPNSHFIKMVQYHGYKVEGRTIITKKGTIRF